MALIARKDPGRDKQQMEDSQREYYLNEKMKAIQQELGGEALPDEFEEIRRKITESGCAREAKEKAEHELSKLTRMPPMSPEATVIRGYLDWLLALPWKKRSRTRRDLKAAEAILDADHYGLEEVKERIVEYLAVQARGKSRGRALHRGRRACKIRSEIDCPCDDRNSCACPGRHAGEAEIRGQSPQPTWLVAGQDGCRRSEVGVRNPRFLLRRRDKIGMDFRWTRSSPVEG